MDFGPDFLNVDHKVVSTSTEATYELLTLGKAAAHQKNIIFEAEVSTYVESVECDGVARPSLSFAPEG